MTHPHPKQKSRSGSWQRSFPWNKEGIAGISSQDYFSERRRQGFNRVNIIASYTTDTTTSAEHVWHADYTRIDPEYWQETDRKMQYLSDNGFVAFIESVRRHEV